MKNKILTLTHMKNVIKRHRRNNMSILLLPFFFLFYAAPVNAGDADNTETWNTLSATPGCIGEKIFFNSDWQAFFADLKSDGEKFESVLSVFPDQKESKIHICNWENASNGVLAVLVAEQVTGRSWLDYNGKNPVILEAVKQAKTTLPQHGPLKKILADPACVRDLQDFFRREYAAVTEVPDEEFPFWYSAFSPSWTPLQVSCFPFALFHEQKTSVYGLDLGLIGRIQDKAYGISFAPLFSCTRNHCGINLSGVFALSGTNKGLTIAPVTMTQDNHGVVIGLFNSCLRGQESGGVQVGLINEADNGILQIGLINQGHDNSKVQIGLYNKSNGSIQFGLINHNADALIPWMPLINFSMPDKVEMSAE